MAEAKPKLNTRAAGKVALAVMASRVLGLVREVLFAGLFGAGRSMDAFFVAFKAPNLLRDLFAEGALSTAFITVFSKKIQAEGDRSAWALASKMATLTLVFMSAITIAGILGADWIIAVLAPGFDPEKAAFTVLLTRIMYPFILMVSLAALVMGMLNAKDIFGVPALASSFFNIGSILGGVTFGWLIDPSFGPRALIGLAIGTLIGGMLQLCVQLPSLKAAGFRFHFDFVWRDPDVRKILVLMGPSVVAGSAVQVNVMVNSIFASFLQDGAVSWLQYAFRLMQLPLGIFGVALSTVTLPALSKIVVSGDMRHFRETLAKAMRLSIFLTIPAATGLIVLGQPIIELIYQRGKFTGTETLRTAEALQFYALGLIGYACIKVVAPAFYALDRKWVPMYVSFVAIGLNIALNYLLIFVLKIGHQGLAISTAVSATANFGLLYFFMRNGLGSLETKKFIALGGKSLLASLGLAAVVWFGGQWIPAGSEYFVGWATPFFGGGNSLLLAGLGFFSRVVLLLSLIGGGIGVYLFLCWAFKVHEVQDALAVFAKKFVRKFGKR